jgi:hypothetical protein
MGEVGRQSCFPKREWHVECYDANGVVARCVIDTDHGAVRIGLTDALENFFELRIGQVGQFRISLDKAIMAHNRIRAGGDDSHQPQFLRVMQNPSYYYPKG